MTVRLNQDGVIVLEADCPIEDAEALLQLVLANREATIDWRGCEGGHAAIIQILMAAPSPLRGPPKGEFLRDWVEPAMSAKASSRLSDES